MNTRAYPRSMAEAFPRTCQYACAVERPARTALPRIFWPVVVIGLLVALAAARS
jgi:hypothetical protein